MRRFRALLWFPYLPLWLAPLVLMAPVWATGRALFWGTPILQFIPWWAYAWETLLAGHLPLWNPYVGMGAPLLANYQSALLYPGAWVYFGLYAFGGVRLMAWGQAFMVALHLAWPALGMALLARRLGVGRTGQAVGGLAFGLCGYLVARAGFLSINAAAAWLPWIILSLTALIEALDAGRSARRPFLALTVCAALQLLAGHAQTTWYTLVLAGMWALFYFLSIRRGRELDRRLLFKILLWTGLALALAAGIAAAQLFPTAEYLSQSQRSSAVDYDYALNYSFWPWRLLTLAAPGLFGSPASGDFWGSGNYWEDAIYVGVLPLLLAVSALIRAARRRPESQDGPIARRRSFAVFLLFLILVSLLLALGSHTPLYPWLYRRIPTFAMFQAPTRWTLLAEFALALLAAAGVDAWRRPTGRALYWMRLGAMGAFAVMAGAGLGWLVLGSVSPTFVRALAGFGLWSLGTALLGLTIPKENAPFDDRRPTWGWWPTAVIAWTALDLLAAGWGLNPAGSLDLYGPSPTAETVRGLAQGGRLYIPPDQEDWLKYRRFLSFKTFDPGEDWSGLRAVNLPNANMLDRLPMVNQFDPLVPAAYAGWLDLLQESPPERLPGLLRLMDIGVIQTLDRGAPDGVRWTAAPRSGRAGVAPCGMWVGSLDEARALLIGGAAEPGGDILLLRPDSAPVEPACIADSRWNESPPAVKLLEDGLADPNRRVIQVDLPASGWVWIAEAWYPGWQARVDHQPAEVVRANYVFQAVRVEAGRHTLVMEYRPVSFYAGGALSLLSLLVLVFLGWKAR